METIKQLEPKTRTGKTRFSVCHTRNLFGEHRTATNVHVLINNLPKRITDWVIAWRNGDGFKIQICEEFLNEGMTIDEQIEDWKAFADESELLESIFTLGKTFGERFEW